jgi:cellulose synthase/poly-beta-1,6-N-acetylglucosamine synthase-like glycosyltransferase
MIVRASDPPPIVASVIVPVFNDADTLGDCLDALLAQTVGAHTYEVIVVDDGSTDRSAEVATEKGVCVLRQEHAGPAAARNRGAQQAKGNILLFTDADCQPHADWIEAMLAPFADPDVAGVKGVYETRQTALVARFTQAEYEEKYDRLARADQIDFVDTYAAAYRRSVFMEQGGFDAEFLLDEDQELSFRLANAGHKLVFAPAATVYHQHPVTVWQYAWRKVQLGRWKVRVHARHPTKAWRDSYTPWTQRAQIVLLPLTAIAAVAVWLAQASPLIVLIPAAVGLLTTIPLLIQASRLGWLVAAAALPLTLVRAAALVVGLGWGLLRRP